MRLGGRMWKEGRHWLVEVPALDATTQGRTRADALRMISTLVATMADDEHLAVKVRPGPDGVVALESSNAATLAALVLRRQREKHGLSLADAARNLGMRSAAAYARHEQGRAAHSVERFFEFLEAVAPGESLVLQSLSPLRAARRRSFSG